VAEVAKAKGGLQVRFSEGGEGGSVDADQVLLAVGRSPYTEGLGAEEAGVKLERGRVVVDEQLRSTAQGVWAIGDVIGGIMLAHIASYEGVCAIENIVGDANRTPDYHAAPNCIYTEPEIAHVGLGEKDAKEKGLDIKVGRFPFAASGRALALGTVGGLRQSHRRLELGQAAWRPHHRPASDRPDRRGDARDPERPDHGAARPDDPRAPNPA